MSFEAVEAVLEQSESREAARLVMICIAERADENRQAFPSMADIARRARLNPQVVARIIDRLVEANELIRLYRIGSSASFIVATGLTSEQIEIHARKSWGKSLRQVVSANKEAAARMGRSKGNKGTLLPKVEGLTLLAHIEGSEMGNPSSEDTTPFEPESSNPSSVARTEPSLTISEPSVRGGDAAARDDVAPQTQITRGKSGDPFCMPSGNPNSRLLNRQTQASGEIVVVETFLELLPLKLSAATAKTNLSAAREILAGGGTADDVRRAFKESRPRGNDRGFTVTDLHSLKNRVLALAAERRAKKETTAATPNYTAEFN